MLIATTVGSELTPTRYTQPELGLQLLLDRMWLSGLFSRCSDSGLALTLSGAPGWHRCRVRRARAVGGEQNLDVRRDV